MGKPYSIDLRERVQAGVESGQSRRAAARRYDVSASFAVKLADRVSRTGSAEPARQGRPPGGGKLALHLTALLEWVDAEPDITMPELAAKLQAEKAVTAHPASLSRVLLKAGLSFKKNTAGHEGRGAVRALGDADLHRRLALRWPRRAVGGRSTHEPCDLRHLCRDPARTNPAAGRRGDPRQPAQPQECQGRGDPQAARSLVPVPAALQPRSQSDRDGVLQTQGPSQAHRYQDNRRPLESHR